MRAIGLDVGNKRIGIAVSDAMGWTAQPLTVYRRKGEAEDIAALCELIANQQADVLVIGLPKSMDGSLREQALLTQAFGEKLAAGCGIEPVWWDERMTTNMAHQVLIQADVSRKKRKGVVDKIAAVFILQNYLDYLSMQPQKTK
ncbi:Putative Holliday junction resolvase [uncultured Clostridium sp.]|nr:Putative Holliday junction resolvase [uncultured Clostridium sp.]